MKFSEAFIKIGALSVAEEFEKLTYNQRQSLMREFLSQFTRRIVSFQNYYIELFRWCFIANEAFSEQVSFELGHAVDLLDPTLKQKLSDLYREYLKNLMVVSPYQKDDMEKILETKNYGRMCYYISYIKSSRNKLLNIFLESHEIRNGLNQSREMVLDNFIGPSAQFGLPDFSINMSLENAFWDWLEDHHKLETTDPEVLEHAKEVEKTNVQPLEGTNQAVMLNIINKLRQRGNVSKQELEQFFNKYKTETQAIRLVNSADWYNQMCMVSPDGQVHEVNGSHPDWAHENYKQYNIDFQPKENQYFDNEENYALDRFFQEGWIRVKPDQGIELEGLHSIPLVKKIISDIASVNPGKVLYIDAHDGTVMVNVNFRGRPDFSKLDQKVGTGV